MDHVLDHADRALSRLPTFLRGKPQLEALVRAIAAQYQAAEDGLWSLVDARAVDGAAGAQLDVLGALVGTARGPLDDADYKIRIRVQIRINRSAGRGDDVLQILRLALGTATNRLVLRELPPASFEAQVFGALDEAVAGALVSILRRARSSAVRGELVWSTVDDAATFTFDGAAPGSGFGTTADATLGGQLASTRG